MDCGYAIIYKKKKNYENLHIFKCQIVFYSYGTPHDVVMTFAGYGEGVK